MESPASRAALHAESTEGRLVHLAGEFQFNVVVPANTPDGDQAITATYNGLGTQAGTLLTVQH